MNEFRLFAHGREFDVDGFLAATSLRPDSVWHRGDQRRYGCGKHPTSGVEFLLGDGREIPLPEQEKIAIEHLSANRDALKELAGWPRVTTFIVALQCRLELSIGVAGCSLGVSKRLQWHALDVGVSPTFYVWLDWRLVWPGCDGEPGSAPAQRA